MLPRCMEPLGTAGFWRRLVDSRPLVKRYGEDDQWGVLADVGGFCATFYQQHHDDHGQTYTLPLSLVLGAYFSLTIFDDESQYL
jgi:hypothetical protein